MRLLLVCAQTLALSGCSLLFTESTSTSVPEADANADAEPDAEPELECGESGLLLTESGEYQFDTTAGQLLSPEGSACLYTTVDGDPPYLRVEVSGDFELGADSSLVVIGIRPLEIIAAGTMTINGEIDVSSYANRTERGAGADVAPCSSQVDATKDENGAALGGGGGGGGSLPLNGADGGKGDGVAALGARTGTIPSNWEGSFRGGCRGGNGGTWTADSHQNFAPGGHGGGALRLIASGDMVISALVHASGAGGGGGLMTVRGGGGGGGSGGMIWLRAASLTMGSGGLSAKGGAGGEGASACGNGADGEDAAGLLGQQAAGGLTSVEGCDAGGDGGAGSEGNFSGAEPGIDGAAGEGGGGGGASPGVIFLEMSGGVATDQSYFSPPPRNPDGTNYF